MQPVNSTSFVVTLLVIATSSYAQNVTHLFLNPSNDTQCSNTCLTLSQYVDQIDNHFASETTLQFLAGDHILQGDSLFVIQNATKFIMAGAPNRSSRIVCNGTTGLSFLNIHSLHVYNLSFVYCGATVSGSKGEEEPRATLHLVNIYDFLMTSSSVENGRGYGLLGINIVNGLVSDSTFLGNNRDAFTVCDNCFNSAGKPECIGGNTFFRYTDNAMSQCPTVKQTFNMAVTNSSFLYGVNLGLPKYNQRLNSGSGLAFELTQSSFNVMITLRGVNSRCNTAVLGANMYIATSDAASDSVAVLIQNSVFEDGNAAVATQCLFDTSSEGAGMIFLFAILSWNVYPSLNCSISDTFESNILNVSNSHFHNNSALFGAGIGMYLIERDVLNYTRYVTIEHCTVDDNMGYLGAAVDINGIQGYPLGIPYQVRVQNTSFVFSQELGGVVGRLDNIGTFRTTSVKYLEFINCNFSFNALAALTVTGTNVIFRGFNIFVNNSGQNGGALSLRTQSTIYLLPNAQMYLVNNTAVRYGGAIYIDDDNHCFLEIYDPTLSSRPNIHLTFANNYAGDAGSILYGGANIDLCTLRSSSIYLNSKAGAVLDAISNSTMDDTSTSPFSSNPSSVCFCSSDNQVDCRPIIHYTEKFPGQTFTVSVVAVGQRNGKVPAVIRASIPSYYSNSNIGNLEASQSTDKTCSQLQYTVFTTRDGVAMLLQVQTTALIQQNNGTGLLISNSRSYSVLFVTLRPCPPAFQLSNVSGACECESRLAPYTSTCNISTQTIERNGDYWVAAQYINTTYEGLIIHQTCPFDYCRPASDVLDLDPSDPNMQCAFNRSGLLCGACGPGLSLVLGTSRCLLCPNTYLALLVPFAIAGVVLVVFLLVLKMTVSIGTINGLIFFANIVAANQSIFFPPGSSNILTVFIAWSNLDLGIETCFYDGMDAYAKTWLQFAFPIYVWVIVGTIIVASHFISTISRILGDNPISVLATLFLISYAKILQTVYAALSFVLLTYPNGSVVSVWLYDGNIRYLRGKHIPLFIAAVLYLLFIFVPFTLLLFSWQ